MLTNDKTYLSCTHQGRQVFGKLLKPRLPVGDLLIDSDPAPERLTAITGKKKDVHPNPPWKHVLYDKPYNRTDTSRPRLKKWINWRNELPLPTVSSKYIATTDSIASFPTIRHGSPDSLDVDMFYVCTEFPDSALCHNFCRGSEEDRNVCP